MIDVAQGSSNAHSDATIRVTTEPVETNAARHVSSDRFKRPWIGIFLVLLAGFVIFFPTLGSPFLLDDYLQAAMVDGNFPVKRGIFDLYDFVNDADRAVLTERGMISWWADPHLQIRFFRPLASALRWGEHLLVGRNGLLLHLHSFFWWFVAVLGARSLYLRALSPRAALLATFIFALAPCHVLPLAWLANREASVSLAFGTFALSAYVQFRDTRRAVHGLTAFVLFAIALFSGEYALSFAGFVLAVELGQRRENVLRRAVGLVPFVVPTIVYLGLRSWLGYGTRGSGYYTDPLHDPLQFVRLAPRRLITLLANGWMSLDYQSLDSTTSVWILFALVAVGVPLVVITMRRLFADLDEAHRRWFAIFAVGSILALIPVMAVSPTPRVIGTSMLGVAPLVAMLLDRAWFVAAAAPRDRSTSAQISGLVTVLLGFAHLIHAPGAAWLSASRFRDHAAEFVQQSKSLRERLVMSEKPEIIVVRSLTDSLFMPFVLDPNGRSPAHLLILSQTTHALAIRRDSRTLDIIVRPDGRIYSDRPDPLLRQDRSLMRIGDVATMTGVRITVLAVGSFGPRIVRYEFDRDLDSPTLTWLAQDQDGFSIEKPLAVGFGKPYDL